MPSRVSEGMVSDRVVEVDAVCRDGSREFGETVEVEGGSFSMIGEVMVLWDPLMVRLTIGTIGFTFCFFVATIGLVLLIF